MPTKTAAFLASCALCFSAPLLGQLSESNYYTAGKLMRNTQGYWINTNIPSGCAYTISEAATKWTNADLAFTFTYRGLTSSQAWYWDTYAYNPNPSADRPGDNVSTASNTTDTQLESGAVDTVNTIAQVERRTYSSTNGRSLWSDADTVYNSNKWSTTAWCSPNYATPSNMVDMQTIALHELGHVIGLGHDGSSGGGYTVMAAYYVNGTERRQLTQRDIDRAVYLYGRP